MLYRVQANLRHLFPFNFMPSGEKEVRNLLKRLKRDDLIGLIDRLRDRLKGADEEILVYPGNKRS